jgi:hypothetical protein
MYSILLPAELPMWEEELALAKRRDADGVLRFNQEDAFYHQRRCIQRHAQEGFLRARIESSLGQWLLRTDLSHGSHGILFRNADANHLLQDALNWYSYNPHHRELVVATILPSKRDEFQRALNRVFQYIF